MSLRRLAHRIIYYLCSIILCILDILCLLSRFPWPLEKGDKLRAYHFLRVLSQHHTLHLVALSDLDVPESSIREVSPFCKSIEVIRITRGTILKGLIHAFWTGLPFQVGYFFSKSAARRIRELACRIGPDAIFCQLVRVAPYAEGLKGVKVLDYQDAFSLNMERRAARCHGISRWLFRREALKLKKYESAVFDQFNHHLVISEPDQQAIIHPQRDTIRIVPNGVDHQFFSPSEQTPRRYDIVFTGNMSYTPNIEGAIWLAHEVMPQVRLQIPGATLLLAGASPARAVRRLASDVITVTGWMPDIREAYRQARVFVAPMRSGSGLQNKLLEAMAMQLPCVTTSLANASLLAQNGTEIIVADEAESMASALVQLLHNSSFAAAIAEAGHHSVKQRFDWDHILGKLNNELFNSGFSA